MNVKNKIPSGYYVYAYLRADGTPYYVGKGCRDRAWNHGSYEVLPNSAKTNIVILEQNLTNIGALALERFYIRWYGRKDLNTGILRNKTDGGDGNSGVAFTDEKCDIFAKEFVITDPNGKVYHIKNLRRFCDLHNLTSSAMSRVARKINVHHKKWQCSFKDEYVEHPDINIYLEQVKEKMTRIRGRACQIISPDNTTFNSPSLFKICKDNDLDVGAMWHVLSGNWSNYKGWRGQFVK